MKSLNRMLNPKFSTEQKKENTIDDQKTSFTKNILGTEDFKMDVQLSNASNAVIPDIDNPTQDWVIFQQFDPKYPYCPVFVDKKQDGGYIYSSYIHGGIVTVSEYQNLILTLLGATEQDIVNIYFDSPGGDLFTGATIASAIEASRAHVKTIACGLCASAGSLGWTAGKSLEISDFAILMFHMSSHMDIGNSVRILENANNLIKYVTEKCLAVAQTKNILTEEEVTDICTKYKEVWIGASETRKRLNIPPSTFNSDGTPVQQEENKENVITSGLEYLQINLNTINEIPAIYTTTDDVTVGSDKASDYRIGLESAQPSKTMYTAEELNKLDVDEAIKLAHSQNKFAFQYEQQQKDPRFVFSLIKLSDGNYQIFLDARKDFWCPKFSTAFCRALDKMTESDKVTIILPGGIGTWCFPVFGAYLSAMERCRAKLTTFIVGPCDFQDIVIWMYGQERIVGNYGKLTLSAEIMNNKTFVDFRGEYIVTILNRAMEINLITEEQKQAFLTEQKSIDIS